MKIVILNYDEGLDRMKLVVSPRFKAMGSSRVVRNATISFEGQTELPSC